MKGVHFFGDALRAHPLRAVVGLGVEYAGYAAACVFAGSLIATRVPLAWVDRVTGLELRERIIERVARLSPG